MDKAERLYKYVNDCFAIDVMNSIFLENYEFANHASFYKQLLVKYEAFGKMLNDSASDENFRKTILALRGALDKSIRECIISQFITYCSRIIDLRYLEGKKQNWDNAKLEQQSLRYCAEREKIVCELENDVFKIQNKGDVTPVEFIREAAGLLRKMEERAFGQFRKP